MNFPAAVLVPKLVSLAVLTPEMVHVTFNFAACPLPVATIHAEPATKVPAGAT